MKCSGCGDHRVTIIVTVPLCELCAKNAQGGGEFGDFCDEQDLESLSLELLETGPHEPESWKLDELWGTPRGTFETA